MIEIKRWTDGNMLYVAENASDVRTAVAEAVREKADLGSADLRSADLGSADLGYADLGSADLGYADLRSADLGYADLRSANLRSANLRYADLGYANLRYANLGYADLRYANLRYADLGYADLRYADLRSADLGYADLRSADLGSADLRYANLRYANLRSADLRSANLRSANLGSADLRSANLMSANLGYADLRYADLGYIHPLWVFWVDFCSILDAAPNEVPGLRLALVEGRVDGSTYQGECACLVGTIANVRHIDVNAIDLPRDGSRPAEQWFLPIREGDGAISDPSKAQSEGVFRASLAVRWVDEWLTSRQLVGAALAKAAA